MALPLQAIGYGQWVASRPSSKPSASPRSPSVASSPRTRRATLARPSRASPANDEECSPTSPTATARCEVTTPQQFELSAAPLPQAARVRRPRWPGSRRDECSSSSGSPPCPFGMTWRAHGMSRTPQVRSGAQKCGRRQPAKAYGPKKRSSHCSSGGVAGAGFSRSAGGRAVSEPGGMISTCSPGRPRFSRRRASAERKPKLFR